MVNVTDNTTTFLRDITLGSFKKYVCSRFPSFELPTPLFPFVRFRAAPPPTRRSLQK